MERNTTSYLQRQDASMSTSAAPPWRIQTQTEPQTAHPMSMYSDVGKEKAMLRMPTNAKPSQVHSSASSHDPTATTASTTATSKGKSPAASATVLPMILPAPSPHAHYLAAAAATAACPVHGPAAAAAAAACPVHGHLMAPYVPVGVTAIPMLFPPVHPHSHPPPTPSHGTNGPPSADVHHGHAGPHPSMMPSHPTPFYVPSSHTPQPSDATHKATDKVYASSKTGTETAHTFVYPPHPVAPRPSTSNNTVAAPSSSSNKAGIKNPPIHPSFQNRKLRAGKWIKEEEEYAEALIQLFEKGLVDDADNGLTLRAYLSRKLHCAPMRISKKFAGKGIGKTVFLGKSSVGKATMAAATMTEHYGTHPYRIPTAPTTVSRVLAGTMTGGNDPHRRPEGHATASFSAETADNKTTVGEEEEIKKLRELVKEKEKLFLKTSFPGNDIFPGSLESFLRSGGAGMPPPIMAPTPHGTVVVGPPPGAPLPLAHPPSAFLNGCPVHSTTVVPVGGMFPFPHLVAAGPSAGTAVSLVPAPMMHPVPHACPLHSTPAPTITPTSTDKSTSANTQAKRKTIEANCTNAKAIGGSGNDSAAMAPQGPFGQRYEQHAFTPGPHAPAPIPTTSSVLSPSNKPRQQNPVSTDLHRSFLNAVQQVSRKTPNANHLPSQSLTTRPVDTNSMSSSSASGGEAPSSSIPVQLPEPINSGVIRLLASPAGAASTVDNNGDHGRAMVEHVDPLTELPHDMPDFLSGFDRVALSLKPAGGTITHEHDVAHYHGDHGFENQYSPTFTSRSFDDFHKFLGKDLTTLDSPALNHSTSTSANKSTAESNRQQQIEASPLAKAAAAVANASQWPLFVADNSGSHHPESYAILSVESAAVAASQNTAHPPFDVGPVMMEGNNKQNFGGDFDVEGTVRLVSEQLGGLRPSSQVRSCENSTPATGTRDAASNYMKWPAPKPGINSFVGMTQESQRNGTHGTTVVSGSERSDSVQGSLRSGSRTGSEHNFSSNSTSNDSFDADDTDSDGSQKKRRKIEKGLLTASVDAATWMRNNS